VSGHADPAELPRFLAEHGVQTVVAAGTDTNGVLRGKRMGVEHFLRGAGHGIALCDVFWVMDLAEEALVERPPDHEGYFPTTAQGYPDILLVPDPTSVRLVPWHERTALVLGTFCNQEGQRLPIDPRATLERVLERARGLGLEPLVGFELEFYVLAESARSLADKGYVGLEPLNLRPYTYGIVGGAQNEPLLARLRAMLAAHGIAVEAANPETGPGQFEVNIRYASVLEAADDAVRLKAAVKEIAQQEGLLATFMAKPSSAWAGSSCHLHVSLAEGERNTFWDGTAGGPSPALRHFLAGVLDTMAVLAAFSAPNVNSYRRYHPYSWAGTTATWATDNRSTGLRVVLEGPVGTRLEHRQAGGDANPYLLAAAVLAAGLEGIERELEPPSPTEADAYLLDSERAPPLPQSLAEALDALEGSELARSLLGEELVDYYVVYKRAEVEAARLAVTDWDVRRYLELL
jgi:glutamine synthetase